MTLRQLTSALQTRASHLKGVTAVGQMRARFSDEHVFRVTAADGAIYDVRVTTYSPGVKP